MGYARVVILGLVVLGQSQLAFGADEVTLTATVAEQGAATTCTQGEHKRTVRTVATEAGKKAPCEVHYSKETEQPGHDQIIYTAANDATFCEAKAQAFIEKLQTMGWACR